jgi:fimbrial chaperone protein
VHLSDAAPTAALTVENSGAAPVVVQLQLMQWSAAGAEDRYQPSDEVVAMPPIMTIRPGEPQIIRMGLTRAVDPQRELAYRLYIEEVPPPPSAGYQGLQVALRIGVPVFVAPAAPAEPLLQWRAVRGGADTVTLYATNVGTAHERLLELTLQAPGTDRPLAVRQAVGDLLPGQSRRWLITTSEALPEGRLRLSVETDRGRTDVDLDPDTP